MPRLSDAENQHKTLEIALGSPNACLKFARQVARGKGVSSHASASVR
jgi:hypothetical protein